MKKCILLVRVSTDAQDLVQQTEKVKQEALKDGYVEENIIIIEDKESGVLLSEEERNGLNRMKQLIEGDSSIDCVYSFEISRISRRANVVFSIRDYLINHHVQLIIISPYFRMLKEDGTLSETSNIFFGIFATMSENEGYIRKARTARGKAKMKAEGKVTNGQTIYGYDINKEARPVINTEQAKVVKEIFYRYSEGEAAGHIAKDLWERGTFHNRKMVSANSFVCKILNEKRYCGDIAHPQIIDTQLFNKCKEMLESKAFVIGRIRNNNDKYLCSGILYTEHGYMLSANVHNNIYSRGFGFEEDKICVNMEATDKITEYAVKQYISKWNVSEKEREQERQELNERKSNNILKINELNRKIKDIQEENDRIENRIIKGKMSESKGDKIIEENKKQIMMFSDKQQELEYQNHEIDNRIIYLASFLLDNIIELDNFDELKRTLHKYCNRIIASKIGFAKYRLQYLWKDGKQDEYSFYSINRGIKFYDKDNNLLNISTYGTKGKKQRIIATN